MKRGRKRGNGRLWKRGRVWVLDYYDEQGQRRQPHLGTNRREAESLQAEIIARRNRITLGLDAAPKDIALDELRSRYLADLEARTSPRHALNVRLQLDRILPALQARTVLELTPSQFLAYRTQLLAQGVGNRCANVHRQALCGMLNWAVRLDLIERNPIEKVPKLPEGPKHQRQNRRALTEAEIERFLIAAEEYDREWENGKPRVPQAPLWRALVETGGRYGEVRQLTWGDLDEEEAVLSFRAETTKAGRHREVPIQEAFLAELQALRGVHWRVLGRRPGVGDPIFLTPTGALLSFSTNNPRRPFNQLLKRAGIDPVDGRGRKVDIHGLRHSAVSRYLRAGAPLGLVQKLVGHSDPRLTAAIYTHLDRDDLRAVIEVLPKRTGVETDSATGT